MLEWCLRLTYTGMTPEMIRFRMLLKHEELLLSQKEKEPPKAETASGSTP